jgi:hypothetical protein
MELKTFESSAAVANETVIEEHSSYELASRELVEAELLAVGGGTGEVTW